MIKKIIDFVVSIILTLMFKWIFGFSCSIYIFFIIIGWLSFYFYVNDNEYLIRSFFITYLIMYSVIFTLVALSIHPSDINEIFSFIHNKNYKSVFLLNSIVFFSFTSTLNKLTSIENALNAKNDSFKSGFYQIIKKGLGANNLVKIWLIMYVICYFLQCDFTPQYSFSRGYIILLLILTISIVSKSQQTPSKFWLSFFDETTGVFVNNTINPDISESDNLDSLS